MTPYNIPTIITPKKCTVTYVPKINIFDRKYILSCFNPSFLVSIPTFSKGTNNPFRAWKLNLNAKQKKCPTEIRRTQIFGPPSLPPMEDLNPPFVLHKDPCIPQAAPCETTKVKERINQPPLILGLEKYRAYRSRWFQAMIKTKNKDQLDHLSKS